MDSLVLSLQENNIDIGFFFVFNNAINWMTFAHVMFRAPVCVLGVTLLTKIGYLVLYLAQFNSISGMT